ncbi:MULTISPECIES: CorA family divalent cation transporter [Clostridium]|uniref:Magnesium transporter n=1 Tax=Clostridium cibarium TaxID=2762247 RepID=A0ABR8PRJ6_9CLOT|nr:MULTISPECIES: CorA family divalent cation transporter [Clostridium]MBD7910801.1 magnesium transporter [Clostridium cibarium]
MVYCLKDNILQKDSIDSITCEKNKKYVFICSFNELENIREKIGIDKEIALQCVNGITSKFESNFGFDFISLMVPHISDPLRDPYRICVYLNNNILAFICDNEKIITDYIGYIFDGNQKITSISKVLDIFFDKLTVEDTYDLENIEEEISELEEGLINSVDNECFKEIMMLRKKLLILKRYYEQFYNIAEGVEENENGLIDQKTIKSFKMLTNRINRLYGSVINLRDYVSQVREAYQAQVDINQNNLMKVFTVITTIFLPLTLIAGWYGMNLKMPEYEYEYSYPIVIFISILIVLGCIICFKKKKWF